MASFAASRRVASTMQGRCNQRAVPFQMHSQAPLQRTAAFSSGPLRRSVLNNTTAAPASRHSLTVLAQAAPIMDKAGNVKIIIQGRKLEVTDAIKQYVQDKVSKACMNQAKEVREVDVTLSARGGDTGTHGKKEQKVEVTIKTVRNGVVRVEDAEVTLYAAIDLVCEKIARKLTQVKERAISRGKWAGRAGPKGTAADDEEYSEYLAEVISETKVFDQQEALVKKFAELNKAFPAEVRRTKVVELDPMTVDEAIESLEAVGHDFFVFREMESDSVQIVYRRQAEGYGVIIPKKRS